MKTRKVTAQQWADAIKVLGGRLESTRSLSYRDIRMLKGHLVGTHAKGMQQLDAIKLLERMGWRIKGAGE